jgi:penicillin-binding protein 2
LASRGDSPRGFLPPDPRVEEPYRLTPQLAFRVAILAFLALGVFAVLFLRLWALEILSGDKYLALANDNRVRTLSLEAPRGQVLDRNGHRLVVNAAGTRVELWPSDLPKSWPAQRRELRALSDVTGVTVKDMLKELKAHGDDPLAPVVVESGLHFDQIAYLREHTSQFPGVRLADSFLRRYPYQSLAAQVLGYVGQISPEEYKQLKRHGYQATDAIGQAGVEHVYDTYLRGRDGSAQLTVDSRGNPKGEARTVRQWRPGETLRLTLDIGLQRAAERALTYGIDLARSGGHTLANGGAIVALDPRNGAVLAMASNPTYKPSIFVGRKDAKKLAPLLDRNVAARENHPGINRAIDAAYPPGSTFKPFTALAAMQERLLRPYDVLACTPTFTAYKQVFKNWTPLIDQGMDLETALAESCDTYFYQLGEDFYRLPSDRGHALQGWANRFGLGEPTGIDLSPESDGLIPTPEWRKNAFPASLGYTEIDRTWKPGYSIQLAIGQGDVLVTPLQLAVAYAVIANGGYRITPHVADDVELTGNDGRPERVLRRFGSQPLQATGVDSTALRFVQQGLYEATHASIGTSSGVFGNFKIPIAGKTGSAEKVVQVPGYPNGVKETQSWWCGYGPYDSPNIVVCAVIENGGHGGTAAAPAALKVFEQYFHTTAPTTSHASD